MAGLVKENVENQECSISVVAEAYAQAGDWIWLSDMRKNILYLYDIRNKRCRIKTFFPKEDKYLWRQHCAALTIGNKIYFVPFRGKHMHVLDITNEILDSVDIGDIGITKNAFIYKNKICVMQYEPNNMLILYDVQSGNIEKLAFPNSNSNGLCRDYAVYDKFVYFVDRFYKGFYRADIENGHIDYIEIKGASAAVGTVCCLGNALFFSTPNEIIRVNIETNESQIYADFPEGFGTIYRNLEGKVVRAEGFRTDTANEQPFSGSSAFRNKIIFWANRANTNIEFDLKTELLVINKLIKEEEQEETLLKEERVTHMHFLNKYVGQDCYVMSTMTDLIYKLSNDGEKIDSIYQFKVGKTEARLLMREIVTESNKSDLKSLLSYIRFVM